MIQEVLALLCAGIAFLAVDHDAQFYKESAYRSLRPYSSMSRAYLALAMKELPTTKGGEE